MKGLMRIAALLFLTGLVSCNSTKTKSTTIKKGVSKKLNVERAKNIGKVVYKLHFIIPEKKTTPLKGELEMAFDIKDASKTTALDFQQDASALHQFYINGKVFKKFTFQNGHILIPGNTLRAGRNILGLEFTPSSVAIKRTNNSFYTLFSPNRASTAFPCFDQPDIKGQFILALDVPNNWVALSNGTKLSVKKAGTEKRFTFGQTKPISTFLFSFAAGKFQTVNKSVKGHVLTMYYLKSGKKNIKKNLDEIMLLQADAITWMEQYTEISYPFQKFDFVLLPLHTSAIGHPGNIYYNTKKMLLDKKATLTEKLDRAHLIARETAHMWFGGLVTMKRLDERWLKNVFINFLADKMTNPSFPTINHKLLFLTQHYPKAYAIDRTEGTYPIQQPTENSTVAETYSQSFVNDKAAILVRNLEEIIGYKKFRKGVVAYLRQFAYSNAGWKELLVTLDKQTDKDLQRWNDAWITTGGMPIYKLTYVTEEVSIDQFDMQNKLRFWPQNIDLLYVKNRKYREHELYDNKQQYPFPIKELPDFMFINGKAHMYGYQLFDDQDRNFLLSINMFRMPALTRGAAYINLWEDMQNDNTSPEALRKIFPYYLKMEHEGPNINLLLGYYQKLFWRFSRQEDRDSIAPIMESLLWKEMKEAPTDALRHAYYKTFINTAITTKSIKRMVSLWEQKTTIKGLALSADDYTMLACELAVRKETPAGPSIPADLLQQQLKRITDANKKKEMAFILPALNNSKEVRTKFFESLKIPGNRAHEPWVLKAMHYMNHPLVANHSENFLLPSMEMLEEIQQTGSASFPEKWLQASFYGHHSQHAVAIIRKYLNKNHDLNPLLRNKILQAADPVFRASKILYSDN